MGVMKRIATAQMFGPASVRRLYENYQGPTQEEENRIVWIKDYAITLQRGKLTCTCPHYQMRLQNTRKLCKHAKLAVKMGYFKKVKNG